jgi:hypothetical protein
MNYSFESAVKILKQAGLCVAIGYKWRDVFLNHVTQKDAQWYSKTSNFACDTPNLAEETTYDSCIDVEISATENSIIIKLLLFNGDNCFGQPTNLRCWFIGELRDMCPEVEQVVARAFAALVEHEVSRREEARLARIRSEVEAQFVRDFIVQDPI